MLQYVADNADQFKTQYGNISTASAGTIQRNLLALESQGADKFFGEPALNLEDLIQTQNGRGVVNILAADKLMQRRPKCMRPFCYGCYRSCSKIFLKLAILRNRSWFSFSTKRTCSLLI